MGGFAELVPWGCLGMEEPSNPSGEPGKTCDACHGAGGCGGFWGQSKAGGDLGEPMLGCVWWVDGIPGTAACPKGGGLAASSFPSPVHGQRGNKDAQVQVPHTEPSPELRAPSPGVTSPPGSIHLCSAASHHRLLFSHTPGVREAKTPSQKIRAEAWLSSRAGVNLFWRYRNYM